MNENPVSPLQSEFHAWLDGALREPIPLTVIAFCFNLAERALGPWCIEVVGSDIYSADDSDWACEESFRPASGSLSLPKSVVGDTWEPALEHTKRLVQAYLDRPSAGSAILLRAQAVAVGFVDGDLHTVFPK